MALKIFLPINSHSIWYLGLGTISLHPARLCLFQNEELQESSPLSGDGWSRLYD